MSPKTLAVHDFRTMLRVIIKIEGFDLASILERLHQRKSALSKSIAGLFGFAIVLYFATPTSQTAFSLNTPYIEIEIPRVIAVLLTSVCWCFGIISLLNYSIIDLYILAVKERLYKRASWSMLDRLYDGDSAWIDPALMQWRFFKSGKLQSALMSFAMLVILLPIILIGLLILVISMRFLISEMLNESLTGKDMAAALLAITLFLFPIIYSTLIFLPLPVNKNREYVRWNFLTPLWRPTHRVHPTSGKWLEQEDIEPR